MANSSCRTADKNVNEYDLQVIAFGSPGAHSSGHSCRSSAAMRSRSAITLSTAHTMEAASGRLFCTANDLTPSSSFCACLPWPIRRMAAASSVAFAAALRQPCCTSRAVGMCDRVKRTYLMCLQAAHKQETFKRMRRSLVLLHDDSRCPVCQTQGCQPVRLRT
jgi:hypothetical protein